MDEAHITHVLSEYRKRFPEDEKAVAELEQLIRDRADITSRKEFRGHVTCGGIVLGCEGRVLMVHHRILNRWLFPGGHLEPEDMSLRDAASREVVEETGLSKTALGDFHDWLDELPIQIDVHAIPADPKKHEPAHRHFDFRFVFRGSSQALNLSVDEVKDWSWVTPERAPAPVYRRLKALATNRSDRC